MLIAQISDIHADDEAASLAAMRRALSYLSDLRPDALILSGDLAETPTEYNYRLVRTMLAGTSFPVFMIPGNADRRAAMCAAFPGHDYWPKSGPMHFAAVLAAKVRVIGFDITVEGQSFGDATAEALDWLGTALQRQPDLPALIVMHQHPFATGIGALDRHMCRNSEGLADLIGRSGARIAAILCGHGHRAVFTRLGRTPAMMCPSLCPANRLHLDGYGEPDITDAPGLLIHHLHEDRMNSHLVSLA
ncbi:phosphodiesterase [soil metagenome]